MSMALHSYCAQRARGDEALEELRRALGVHAERHVLVDAVVAQRLLGRVDGGAERAHGRVGPLELDAEQVARLEQLHRNLGAMLAVSTGGSVPALKATNPGAARALVSRPVDGEADASANVCFANDGEAALTLCTLAQAPAPADRASATLP